MWWPWPLSAVQSWFENFYNSVSNWVWGAAGQLWGQIQAGLGAVQGALNASVGWLWGQVQAGLGALQSTILQQLGGMQVTIGTAIQNLTASLLPVLGGLWQPVLQQIVSVNVADFASQVQAQLNALGEVYADLLRPRSIRLPDVAVQLAWQYWQVGRIALWVLTIAKIAAETASLGLVDFTLQGVDNLPEVQQFRLFTERLSEIQLETAIYRPVQHYYNRLMRSAIPDIIQIINIATKLGLDSSWVQDWGGFHGLAPEWISSLIVAQQTIPSVETLFNLHARGALDWAELLSWLQKSGLRTELIPKVIMLYDQIPGPSDLIRFVVREVISPTDFVQWMARQRYSKYWADAFWEAHWVLPGLGDLREAMWRGIISYGEYTKYIVWHDYKPEPRPGINTSDRDIIFQLSFKLPGRIDARWMLRWGIINYADLVKLAMAEGLHPDWAPKVAQAELLNNLLDERTLVRNAYLKLYKIGALTRDELYAKLREIYFSPEEAEWICLRAELEGEADELEDMVKAAVDAFRRDLLQEGELFTLLTRWGIRPDRAEHIVRREAFKKLPRL